MTVNYILLVHKNPEQVKALISRLNHANCFFYIHVDKDAVIQPFRTVCSEFPNVFFVEEREKGRWGDIGIVKGTLNAISKIISDKRNGYCVLLSGQDLPLQSNEDIIAFFESANGATFMDYFPLPSNKWFSKGLNRIKMYKFHFSDNAGDYFLLPSVWEKELYKNAKLNFRRIFSLIKQRQSPFCLLKKRRFPAHLKPYGGSQWWAFTVDTAKKIGRFLHENTEYLRYHKHTLLCDEMFFQSILAFMAITDKNIVIKPPLTYTQWENDSAAHPQLLEEHQLAELSAQEGKLFARKFNFA